MLYSLLVLVLIGLFQNVSFACASCGCSLSSDWQSSSPSGFKLDLRYDYINQNQLRSGASTISSPSASQISNNGSPQEVEKYTANKYATASLDYVVDPNWKINMQVPYIMRDHSTMGTASDGITEGAGGGQYSSNTSSLGDLKLVGRYQGFSQEHNWGALFGIKLPTGSHSLNGISTDSSAPGSVAIDRGLQPGTGTTDILLGLFYSEDMNKEWSYFGEGIYQTALNSSDQYRPGDSVNLNLGFRYVVFESWTPQLQINSHFVQRDSGTNADTISTGGTLIYLSPGFAAPVGAGVELYAFVQIPVYQYLYGVQLVPTSTDSLGVRYNF